MQKTHSTNYYNTFIEVAEDTKATCSTLPKSRGEKQTVAERQYELLSKEPYVYTSDELLFKLYAERQGFDNQDLEEARMLFFSKGQACMRCSPLGKSHGFGVHANAEGKLAIYGLENPRYQEFIEDASVKKVKAMRQGR